MSASKTAMNGFMLGSVILHPILMFSLSLLWGNLNWIQIVAYYMLLDVNLPANILIVLEVFYEVVTFDIIPVEYVFGPVMKRIETDEETEAEADS